MNLDKHGQPVDIAFNYSRNVEKAAFGLRGILQGIVADQILSQQELLFLDVWLSSEQYLRDDGDVVDLLDLISSIIEDGTITPSELVELNELIDDIIKYKKIDSIGYESQLNELMGLLTGIVVDSQITESEIDALIRWLSVNESIREKWPANVIIHRLKAILEDGIVSEDEKLDLLETLKKITGSRFDESGLAHGMSTEFLEDVVHGIQCDGSCFCFTGAFYSGTRKAVESSAQTKGATTKRDVSKSVNYLVIGTIASRDWRFSNHGRKIEKALALKQEGHPIIIITERTWVKYSKIG